jgi:hypothetical protein
MVRSVASVSAKNESSPEDLGTRDVVLVRVHFGSLRRADTQGIEARRSEMASAIVVRVILV